MNIVQRMGVVCGVVIMSMMGSMGAQFAQAASDTQLFLYGNNQHQRGGVMPFSSQQEVVVNVDGNIAGEITVDIFESNIDEVLDFLVYDEKKGEYGDIMNMQKHSMSSIDSEAIVTMTVKTDDSFTVPMNKTGVRLVRARGGNKEVYSFVVRSDIGAVVNEGMDDKLIFWTQDMTTKRSMAGVQVDVYSLKDKKEKTKSVTTGVNGVGETTIDARDDLAVVRKDGDYAILPINLQDINSYGGMWSTVFQKYKAHTKHFLFTDRTLYKPGDSLYFKSVVRKDNDVRYSIPQEGKYDAAAIYGWGDDEVVVVKKTVVIDKYGTLSGELLLPADTKTGKYRLELTKQGDKNDSIQSYFNIEYYRKPAQTVSVSIDKQEIVSGDNIEFQIKGKYFSGEVLSGERVRYTIYRQDFYDPSRYQNFQKDDYKHYGFGGEEVSSGETVLDNNGHALVSVPTTITSGDTKVYTVEISFKPKNGEPVQDQESVLVYAGDYGIYRGDDNYSAKVGELAQMQIELYPNVSGAEIANQNLTVGRERIWWEKDVQRKNGRHWYTYNRQEEKLSDMQVVTNSDGKAIIQFTPNKSGSYKIIVKNTSVASDAQMLGDNFVQKTFNIWIYDDDRITYSRNSSGVSIVKKNDIVVPGNNVLFEIMSEQPNRDVFVSVQRDFVQDYQVVSLQGTKGVAQFQIKDSYMPRVSISAETFGNQQLDSTREELKVSTNKQKLIIDITPNKDNYSPGDDVTLVVTTSDANGAPQKADIALWAVDKAIFELAKPANSDIFAMFWEYRRGWTSMMHSLRGITVSMAEGGGCFGAETPVLMADGTTQKIQNVRIGDMVLTRQSETSTKLVPARVTATPTTQTNGYLIINDDLRVTANHLLFVNNKWKRADRVTIGDILVNNSSNEVVVTSIEWRGDSISVYNLTVDNQHTYFAGGVFVHNGKGAGAGRSVFKDTAYWNPHIVTDEHGKATISFKLPDDLTTWSIGAIGATLDTKVGNAVQEVIVQQQFILRPSLPSIVRVGDVVQVTTNVQNLSDKKMDFVLDLAIGEEQEVDRKQSIAIESGGKKVVSWQVEVIDGEELPLIFSMYAADGVTVLDRITKIVPAEQFGFWETRSWAGYGAQIPFKLDIPKDARNHKSQINLTTASTLLGSLSGSAKYLIHYPYGCMEQTVSRFIPAILAKENPQVFDNVVEVGELDDMIARGIERLRVHQNADGGWSWWSDGESDLFISLYVADYLQRAQELGADTSNVLEESKNYFASVSMSAGQKREDAASPNQMKVEKVLISAGNVLLSTKQSSRAIIKMDATLPIDVIAMGTIANAQNGFDNPKYNGAQILESLLQRKDNHVWWISGNQALFGARNAPSAMALRAFIVGGGDVDIAREVVRTLRDNRQNEYWSNTFVTAQVLDGLTQFAKIEAEIPKATGGIINIGSDKYQDILFGEGGKTVLSSIDLKDITGNNISVQSTNDASIYATLFMKLFRTDRNAPAVANGITLERAYVNTDKSKAKTSLGDTVEVTLQVSGIDVGQKYLVVEDQLPAGMVPVNQNLNNVTIKNSNNNWRTNVEYTKSGVIMSREQLGNHSTQTFSYFARVVSLGEFVVPPATASLMYSPDIYARTKTMTINISEKSGMSTSSKHGIVQKFSDLIYQYGKIIAGALVLLAGAIIIYTKPWQRRK